MLYIQLTNREKNHFTFTPAFTHPNFAEIKKGSNLLKPLLGLYPLRSIYRTFWGTIN